MPALQVITRVYVLQEEFEEFVRSRLRMYRLLYSREKESLDRDLPATESQVDFFLEKLESANRELQEVTALAQLIEDRMVNTNTVHLLKRPSGSILLHIGTRPFATNSGYDGWYSTIGGIVSAKF